LRAKDETTTGTSQFHGADLVEFHGADLVDPVADRIWHRLLMTAARFRAWLLGGVYTAGAAAVIVAGDDSLLLVKPWYRQGWGLPGGFMKYGEQAADTVRRELLEETGFAVDVTHAHEVYVQRGRRHIDHLFVVRVESRFESAPKVRGEITAARWCHLDDLPPLQREAHYALQKALS
jgi:ADP-ribose pyrophosphatase YjhB (NUDIX family)